MRDDIYWVDIAGFGDYVEEATSKLYDPKEENEDQFLVIKYKHYEEALKKIKFLEARLLARKNLDDYKYESELKNQLDDL